MSRRWNAGEVDMLAPVSKRRRFGLAVAAVWPSETPLSAQRTPGGWEAETGPPLTSEGLSVSCNRK